MMTCELCAFLDRRRVKLKTFRWQDDGVPLLTVKESCSECGWWQVVAQVWVGGEGE